MTCARSAETSSAPARFSCESSESGRKRDMICSRRSNSASTASNASSAPPFDGRTSSSTSVPIARNGVRFDHDVLVITSGGSVTIRGAGAGAATGCRARCARSLRTSRLSKWMRCSRAASAAICAVARRALRDPGTRGDDRPHDEEDEQRDGEHVQARDACVSHRSRSRLRLVLVLAARAVHDADDRLRAHVDRRRLRRGCVAALGRTLRLGEQRPFDLVELTVPGRDLRAPEPGRAPRRPSCVVRDTANRPATAAAARTTAMTNVWMRFMPLDGTTALDQARARRQGKGSAKPLQNCGSHGRAARVSAVTMEACTYSSSRTKMRSRHRLPRD